MCRRYLNAINSSAIIAIFDNIPLHAELTGGDTDQICCGLIQTSCSTFTWNRTLYNLLSDTHNNVIDQWNWVSSLFAGQFSIRIYFCNRKKALMARAARSRTHGLIFERVACLTFSRLKLCLFLMRQFDLAKTGQIKGKQRVQHILVSKGIIQIFGGSLAPGFSGALAYAGYR